jgi:hypothetical protein
VMVRVVPALIVVWAPAPVCDAPGSKRMCPALPWVPCPVSMLIAPELALVAPPVVSSRAPVLMVASPVCMVRCPLVPRWVLPVVIVRLPVSPLVVAPVESSSAPELASLEEPVLNVVAPDPFALVAVVTDAAPLVVVELDPVVATTCPPCSVAWSVRPAVISTAPAAAELCPGLVRIEPLPCLEDPVAMRMRPVGALAAPAVERVMWPEAPVAGPVAMMADPDT